MPDTLEENLPFNRIQTDFVLEKDCLPLLMRRLNYDPSNRCKGIPWLTLYAQSNDS